MTKPDAGRTATEVNRRLSAQNTARSACAGQDAQTDGTNPHITPTSKQPHADARARRVQGAKHAPGERRDAARAAKSRTAARQHDGGSSPLHRATGVQHSGCGRGQQRRAPAGSRTRAHARVGVAERTKAGSHAQREGTRKLITRDNAGYRAHTYRSLLPCNTRCLQLRRRDSAALHKRRQPSFPPSSSQKTSSQGTSPHALKLRPPSKAGQQAACPSRSRGGGGAGGEQPHSRRRAGSCARGAGSRKPQPAPEP